MLYTARKRQRNEQGFSLLEMLLATIILLVGLLAIAQLVPASILLNFRNRTDSSALVFAQRELDQMLDQPLVANSFTDPLGVYCPLASTCNLGDPTQPNQIVGSPVVVIQNQALIDFTAAPVANYSFNYLDPADPSGTTYDIRWAVIITGTGGSSSGKRFILGIRQQGGSGYFQPVTLDTMVQK
jgi:prepilin-type N-terminal cleavage/methylation domain-containing protein